MPGHHFISYSKVEAKDFALKLGRELQGGPPPIPVWIDEEEIKPSLDWDEQIVEGLRECRTLLFVMTPDSVSPTSVCKQEWTRALKYKKPIVPLLLDRDAEMPFRLEPRQYIDFTGDFKTALAKLRKHLVWLDSSKGELHALEERLADAQRALPRAADEHETARIEEEITELGKQIEKQQALIKDPEGEKKKTEKSIKAGLERERKPERPVAGESRTKFINPPPALAPTYFQDRFVEIGLIADFLKDESRRLLTVAGRAGVGKTALAVRVLKSLEGGQLPDDRGPLTVDGIVYLSARGSHRVDLPNLYTDLCKLLPKDVAQRLDSLYKDPHVGTEAKMAALLEAFPQGRTVVLLDNFETLVSPESREMTDEELKDALTALLELPQHGVKVILTTRIAPRDLALICPACQMNIPLDEGLESPFAENILREMDTDGKLVIKDAPDELLDKARERTRGFPRALEALYAILAADRETTLPELLKEEAPLPENVVEALVGEAFNRLDPLAQQVMEGLAVYNRPVTPAAADYLLQPYRPGIDSGGVLGRLVNMHFVHRESGRYYLHPADQEYAISRIPEAIVESGKREAGSETSLHSSRYTLHDLLTRAADYYRQARQPRETWKSLADLTPQLAEFELRCKAGDYDTAAKELVEIDFSFLHVWGHYRLMIQLHESLLGNLEDQRLQIGSFRSLGLANRIVGQFCNATNYLKEAVNLAREIGDRYSECDLLGDLGLVFVMVGETHQSIEYYETALQIAQEIDSKGVECNCLLNLGNRHAELMNIPLAIEFHDQALVISREIGKIRSEIGAIGNRGKDYAFQGDVSKAIHYCKKALKIANDSGYRLGEGFRLSDLGNFYADIGNFQLAFEYHHKANSIFLELGDKSSLSYSLADIGFLFLEQNIYLEAEQAFRQSIQIADEIGFPYTQNYSRLGLALAQLFDGDLVAAHISADQANKFNVPQYNHHVRVVLGVILIRLGNFEKVNDVFSTSVILTDTILRVSPKSYQVLDIKGLALGGLALCGEDGGSFDQAQDKQEAEDRIKKAREVFVQARSIFSGAGYVGRVLRLFDALAVADEQGVLAGMREVIAGE